MPLLGSFGAAGSRSFGLTAGASGPTPPPLVCPKPDAEPAPKVPNNGIIFLLLIYYANCVCDANAVNVASPVLIIVYE